MMLKTLKLMQIDENGLDRMDRKIINTLFESFDGGLVKLIVFVLR